jgi:hypothetical protein
MMRNLTLYTPGAALEQLLSVLVSAGATPRVSGVWAIERGVGAFLYFEPVGADELAAVVPYDSPQAFDVEMRGLAEERQILERLFSLEMWVANDWWLMPASTCKACMSNSSTWDPFSARKTPREIVDKSVRYFEIDHH